MSYGVTSRRALTALLTGLWLLASAGLARAADPDPVVDLRLDFRERDGALQVGTLDLGPFVFDQGDYGALAENPLATVVVVRLYVYERGGNEPVGFRLMTLRIVYDLWLEEYEVRIDDASGRRSGRYAKLKDAYRAMTTIDGVVIADLDDIAIGPHYYLGVVAELNPVSPETMAQVRRWLTRPAGAARLDRETSFFGSFVSVFVNARLPEAERVVRARSQPFFRAPR